MISPPDIMVFKKAVQVFCPEEHFSPILDVSNLTTVPEVLQVTLRHAKHFSDLVYGVDWFHVRSCSKPFNVWLDGLVNRLADEGLEL
jgi:hypothetical protein